MHLYLFVLHRAMSGSYWQMCWCSLLGSKRRRDYSDVDREAELRRKRYYEANRARMRMEEDLWRMTNRMR